MSDFTKEQIEELKENEFAVFIDNTFVSIINKSLVFRQNVSDKLDDIKQLHRDRFILFEECEKADPSDSDEMKRYVSEFREIEFKLQELWGFGRNEKFHEWYTIPHCICPKMDNADMRGTDYNIYTNGCPMHSHLMVGNIGDNKIKELPKEKSPVEQDIEDEVKYKHLEGKWVAYESMKEGGDKLDLGFRYTHFGYVTRASYQMLDIEHSGLYLHSSHEATVNRKRAISVEEYGEVRLATDIEIAMHKEVIRQKYPDTYFK